MKICILGDTHLDIKHYSEIYHEYFEKFYSDIFFPYLIKNEIEIVIQTGDLFNNKKQINFNSLDKIEKYFFSKFYEHNIELHSIIGNHDIPNFRKTLNNSAQSKLFRKYKNCWYYDKPTKFFEIDLIPWICKDNEEEILKYVKDSNSKYCIGHFEFSGFSVSKGYEMKEGLSHKLFHKYEKVISGHYHTKSEKDNVIYTGTPYQLTWTDVNDTKGFYVFDTSTSELEFIENPYELFSEIIWNDSEIGAEKYTNQYLKILVKSKQNEDLFNKTITKLEKHCYSVDIIESLILEEDESVDDYSDVTDTKELISKYIKNTISKDIDSSKLENILFSLYEKAVVEL